MSRFRGFRVRRPCASPARKGGTDPLCRCHHFFSFETPRVRQGRTARWHHWLGRLGSHGSEVWYADESIYLFLLVSANVFMYLCISSAVAWGNHTTVISSSASKRGWAMELNANKFLLSSDSTEMTKASKSLDVIIDTVSAKKPMQMYLNLLATDGKLCNVGIPGGNNLMEISPNNLILARRSVMGSSIASNSEIKEMLDFCAEHSILPETEELAFKDVNTAFDRLQRGDVKGRFVLKM